MIGSLDLKGELTTRKIKRPGPPKGWGLKNRLRLGHWWGILSTRLAKALTRLTGIPTITSELEIIVCRVDGTREYYDVVSRRVVTAAGVAFIVDAWDNTVELEMMNYHGCGTNSTAEAAGDTALGAESTTALNPDSTRGTGTKTQPAANQLRTTGTLVFDNTVAVVEHGLFSQAATGGGVLFDRSVFSAINVVSGDSITFQYTVTFNSGG